MNNNIKCNMCGKKFDIFDEQQRFEIMTRVMYGSVHDGDHIDIRFCCDCMDKIVDMCAISPVIPEEEVEW